MTPSSVSIPVRRRSRSARLLYRDEPDSEVDLSGVRSRIAAALALESQDAELADGVIERVGVELSRLSSAYIQEVDVNAIVTRVLMETAVREGAERPFWYRVASRYVITPEGAITERNVTEEPAAIGHVPANLDLNELRARIRFSGAALELGMPEEEIERELLKAVRQGMTLGEVRQSLVHAAAELQLVDTPFQFFAARFLLSYLYEDVLGWSVVRDGADRLHSYHERYFTAHVRRLVEEKLLDPALLSVDLDRLARDLDPTADFDLNYTAVHELRSRFLMAIKNDGRPRLMETPQFFWMRVALGCNLSERKDEVLDRTLTLYRLFKERKVCPSQVVLMHAGRPRAQFAQSYGYYVPDSIAGIFHRGIVDNSLAARNGASASGNWSSVRGTGAFIAGTNGESQGLIPFLKLHNDQLLALAPDGEHPAEGAVALELWHNDVLEFLELRLKQGDERRRTTDLNTVLLVSDLFMRRVEAREQWTLFRSNEVTDLPQLYGSDFESRFLEYERRGAAGEIYAQQIPAIEIWKKMLKMIFDAGFPRLVFKDNLRRRGYVDCPGATLLCNVSGESVLTASPELSASSFHATVSLPAHGDEKGSLQVSELKVTVAAIVRALDNLISQSAFATDAAKKGAAEMRLLSVAPGGVRDLLVQKGIGWTDATRSAEVDAALELFSFCAIEASLSLAKERGAAAAFAASHWAKEKWPFELDGNATGPWDWPTLKAEARRSGLRNLQLVGLPDSGVEFSLLSCSPGIRPLRRLLEIHKAGAGDFCVVDPYLVAALKKRGEWDDVMRRALLANGGAIALRDGLPRDAVARLRLLPKEVTSLFAGGHNLDVEQMIREAAGRLRWIDGNEMLETVLPVADSGVVSRFLRSCWREGLKQSPRIIFGAEQ